ncbi:non-homologous end-joining DNA ligase [Mycoplasmatota bacterium]|nr:non-homologous end-joining DNA ligase [Mycoplasmatota bacterium]
MKDIYEMRSASPMLLTDSAPFDSDEHIFELKLDGIRCLAYIEKGKVELRNKRNKILNDIYPELKYIHKCVNKRCILDGELIVLSKGKPDFFKVQKRSLMNNKFKIELSSKQNPVMFIAYDILYLDDKELILMPLLDRKKILEEIIRENKSIAVSRYILDKGIDYYNSVAEQDLEGVVAKRKDSIYQMGKRSKSWVKFKLLHDSDFIIVGYVPSESRGIKSLTLGVYKDKEIINQGHVSLGIPKDESKLIMEFASNHRQDCPFNENVEADNTIWFKAELVCTVKYMVRTESGYLRQPIYKGLRNDKSIEECTIDQF